MDCPESCEGDALTLPRVTNWENQVAEVVRTEERGGVGVWPASLKPLDGSFLWWRWQCWTPCPCPHLVSQPVPSASSLLYKSFVIVSYVSAVQFGPEWASIIVPQPQGWAWTPWAHGWCCAAWSLWSSSLFVLWIGRQRKTCSASKSGWWCPQRMDGRLAAETDTTWSAAGILGEREDNR